MTRKRTYKIALTGLLVAAGLLLPYLSAHMLGLPGTIFLPMHIPVLLAGLLCGPGYGVLAGLLIPGLSALLTGMPALFPMLPIITGELAAYGLVSGLLYGKTGKIYASMLPAMLCGRVVYGLIFAALLMANGGALRALSVTAAFVQGLPGIALQLLFIPLIVKAAQGNRRSVKESCLPLTGLAQAKQRIQNGQATCIVLQKGAIVREASGIGIKPILQLMETQPDMMKGAHMADKIIGKAAAMLFVFSGVTFAYGELMSDSGRDYLEKHGVAYAYGRCIDVVSNRSGNGICPLEMSVMDIDDPAKGYEKLKETVAILMQAM